MKAARASPARNSAPHSVADLIIPGYGFHLSAPAPLPARGRAEVSKLPRGLSARTTLPAARPSSTAKATLAIQTGSSIAAGMVAE